MKKLRSSKGETLTETLVAVLITALSALLLATLTGTAVRLSQKADGAARALYGQISQAEAGGEARPGSVTVNGETVPVWFYGAGDGLTSYRAKGGGA